MKKYYKKIDQETLLKANKNAPKKSANFCDTIITANEDEVKLYELLSDYKITKGGNTRQQSLKNALSFVNSEYVLVTDVARACIPQKLVLDLVII